jgi:hypothetical protein
MARFISEAAAAAHRAHQAGASCAGSMAAQVNRPGISRRL